MPITIVETVGSGSANSFVSVAEADAYLGARLNSSAWTGTEPKKIALIEATRELTRLVYQGYRTDDVQALAFPRTYCPNPDIPSITALTDTADVYFADDEIPTRIKEAQIELALEFLKAGTTDLAALDGTIGIVREKVGPLETEFAQPYQRAQGLARFPRVLDLIAPLLDSTATSGLEVVRM